MLKKSDSFTPQENKGSIDDLLRGKPEGKIFYTKQDIKNIVNSACFHFELTYVDEKGFCKKDTVTQCKVGLLRFSFIKSNCFEFTHIKYDQIFRIEKVFMDITPTSL